MSKAIRGRKAERKKAEQEQEQAAIEAREAAREERKTAPPQPSDEPEPAPKLATDDLMAIAAMDPAELAALMEGSVATSAFEAGQEVTGVVTRVSEASVLVDVGGKSEAWIERGELPEARVGEQITAFVLHVGESSVRLSTKLSGDAAGAFIEEAFASEIPVEGRVSSANKGGFEVMVGSVRAFCPRSLIARHFVDEPEVFVGQTLQFKVIETGDKIVLSRRALEEERAEKLAADLWARVEEGDDLEGVVRSVQPFGAFVDLGGVDGLIPKSELSWSQGTNAGDLVSVGESVTVRVIKVDREAQKLTLSLKSLSQAPWKKMGSEFIEGGIYEGTVARITTFGVFVTLADGLDGLIHTSRLAAGVPKQGDVIQVRVLGIDDERQRIQLAPFAEGQEQVEEEQVSGTVAEVMRNGVVVQLDDGRTGWLPAGEVDLPAGTVLAQRYRRGRKVSARVIDASRPNRLTLSTRTQSDDQSWRVAQQKAKKADSGFGTLGDLFAGLNLPKK